MIRLAVRVRREDAELVLAELLSLAPSGVEEVDDGDVVEYAVYGAPGELPDLPDLRAAAGDSLVEVTTCEIPDDWAERWREFHRPVTIGGRIAVRPPWEPAQDAEIDIVVDPGQAFGTGAHPTTRLCLELLLQLMGSGLSCCTAPSARCNKKDLTPPCCTAPSARCNKKDLTPPCCALLDLGCGSGVLAIAAAKLGFAPVLAVDHDPLAVQATVENARVNRVAVEAARLDLRTDPLPAAPVVVANLLRPLLLTYAELMTDPPEQLIVSGLLPDEVDEVVEAFARHQLRDVQRRTSDDWAAARLARWS